MSIARRLHLQLQAGHRRLFSSYTTAAGERIWVITEVDRSVTTFLLPDEY
jgi:hypothetical protein